MPKEIQELYTYNRWANARMLGAVATLTDEERHRPLGGSFPSLQGTLVHLLGAEWIWLRRWKGSSPEEMPTGWSELDWEALRRQWREVEEEQRGFVTELTAERLAAVLEYRNTAGKAFAAPLWQLMRHLVNHSTYHRGQITMLLRQLSHPAVSTDLVLFYREAGGG